MSETTVNKIVYKKVDQSTTLERAMKPLSDKHKVQSNSIISKFIKLLKASQS